MSVQLRKNGIWYVAVVLLAVVVSGCPQEEDILVYEEYGSATTTEVVSLSAGGRLDVTNNVGAVSIVGTDGDTVTVTSTKVAFVPENGTNLRPLAWYLDQIEVDISGGGSAVNIGGNVPPATAGFSGSVEFVIEAPAAAVVDLLCNMGPVQITGMGGAITFSVDTGSVGVTRHTTLGPQDGIQGQTGVGDIRVTLPGDSAFTLESSTNVGSIAIDDAFDIQPVRRNVTGAAANGTVSAGGAVLDLWVDVGSIHVMDE